MIANVPVLTKSQTQRQLDGIFTNPGGTYIFIGPKGVGKSEAAIDIAGRLCANSGNAIIQEPNEKRSIGIADVIGLERLLSLKPTAESDHRVVVVKDADSLTAEAQNALLKTLEEPPSDTTIILTSAQRGQILPTILSRCKIISFQRLSREEIANYLGNQPGLDAKTVDKIAILSQGAVAEASKQVSDPAYRDWLDVQHETAAKLLDTGLYERLVLASNVVSSKDLDPLAVAEQMAAIVRERLSQSPDDRQLLKQLQAIKRFLVRSGSNVNIKLAFDQLVIGLDHA